jgi:hypothetical protein
VLVLSLQLAGRTFFVLLLLFYHYYYCCLKTETIALFTEIMYRFLLKGWNQLSIRTYE